MKILLSFLFLGLPFLLPAQHEASYFAQAVAGDMKDTFTLYDQHTLEPITNVFYFKVDSSASFSGGKEALGKLISMAVLPKDAPHGGIAVMSVYIGPDGSTLAAFVDSVSDPIFRGPAKELFNDKLRWHPAWRDGKKVASVLQVKLVFR